jgi:Copper type II ascorbate-dependent monooxygenase, C-terminal domain
MKLRLALASAVLSLCPVVFAQGPTYSKEVSRIFQAKCEICHREGDVAPFVLNGYDSAVAWAADIQRTINDGTMPPWKPVPGYGEFRDSFALSDDEKQTVLSWIANGMDQGDPSDLPDPVVNSGAWPLGDPDVVLQPAAAYTPPRGKDVYRCFVLPDIGLDRTKFLSAIDVLPGNRQIVHHVLVFADTTGTAVNLDGHDVNGDPGYDCFGGPGFPIVDTSNLATALDTLSLLGGWAPGQRTHVLPDGIGLQLTANARLVVQVHYYPVGRTGPDQTMLGLYFAKTEVKKRLYLVPVINTDFQIPPDTVKDVTAVFPPIALPFSAQVINIFPHMHLLGRKIKVDLLDRNDKLISPMIYENNWNFNWQGAYTYVQPVAVPFFAKVRVTCTFDNTKNNPKNPNDPLVTVGWGERTTDEMCIAFAGITLDNDPFTILRTLNPVK